MIRGSINLSKVNKEKLYTGKNGDKYLNIVIWENDEPDRYGNTHAIQQSFSAEDRKAGLKAPYIGNAKGADAAPKKTTDGDEPW